MTAPNAPAAQDQYAPEWRLLRTWRDLALKAAGRAAAQLSRSEVEPILRWIFVLEFILRRLVLIAATALAVRLRPRSTRAAARMPSARTTTAHPKQTPFRLYAPGGPPHGHVPRASDAAHATAHREAIPANETPQQPSSHKPRYPLPIDTLLRADHDNQHDGSEPPEQPEQPAPQAPPAQTRARHLRRNAAGRARHLSRATHRCSRQAHRPRRPRLRAQARDRHAPSLPAPAARQRRPAHHAPAHPRHPCPLHDELSDILFNFAHANTS
jgi:hypothetical protein